VLQAGPNKKNQVLSYIPGPMSMARLPALVFVGVTICGCSYFDRADRLRSFDLGDGRKVGINVTDATRRLAVIYPDGRTCSELSPPAVLEVDKAFKAGAKVGDTGSGGVDASVDSSKKSTAVQLLTSTEKIECLRISLFHACAMAAAEKMTAGEEIDLYEKVISSCYKN
jgi:hypothetical protein